MTYLAIYRKSTAQHTGGQVEDLTIRRVLCGYKNDEIGGKRKCRCALPSPDTGQCLLTGMVKGEEAPSREARRNNSSLGSPFYCRCRRPGESTSLAALRKLAVSLLVGETQLSCYGPFVVGGALKFEANC